MENLYIYIETDKLSDVIKYGMKLSEFSNKILNISETNTKSGITAFLSPKDSELYYNKNYTCIRFLVNDVNCYIYNKTCENTAYFEEFITEFENYKIGDYDTPIALICSTILPEYLYPYNKIIDIPLLVQNSNEYYYEKFVSNILDSGVFSNYELYQLLLILGNNKKLFEIKYDENGTKIYHDSINNKNYIKKGNI